MENQVPHRGGAPVGYISELGPIEAGAIVYFRLWFEAPACRGQILRDFQTALGKVGGAKALTALTSICDLCIRHGRRPIMRHGVQCKCIGGDEACFANFIAYASEGELDDALLMASSFVAPSKAPDLVEVAEEFGCALRGMFDASFRSPKSTTIH
ncbi:MAG: hypothetical protein AAGJ34_07980 [Pseudomonadota bacterium]